MTLDVDCILFEFVDICHTLLDVLWIHRRMLSRSIPAARRISHTSHTCKVHYIALYMLLEYASVSLHSRRQSRRICSSRASRTTTRAQLQQPPSLRLIIWRVGPQRASHVAAKMFLSNSLEAMHSLDTTVNVLGWDEPRYLPRIQVALISAD